MIRFYRQNIVQLLNQIHILRQKPYGYLVEWKELQEAIIAKIFYFERKIIDAKTIIKESNQLRKSPTSRLSKEESLKIKDRIKEAEYKFDEYHFLIKLYKNIGDAIAFTFWDKLDIKPQVFKQSPGFISGKTGFKQEKKMFNYAYKNGVIAILHDITSALRYADLSLCREELPALAFEVKTSNNINPRVLRQKDKAQKLFNYLHNDEVKGLYTDDETTMVRVAVSSKEVNYIDIINQLIELSKLNGYATSLVEPGLFYGVFRDELDFQEGVPPNFDKPVAFILNDDKYQEYGYFPLTLSIINPSDYVDFIEGKYVVVVIVDHKTIVELVEGRGCSISKSERPNYCYILHNKSQDALVQDMEISYHYLGRVFYEFVSLKWLMDDSINQLIDPPEIFRDTAMDN